MWHCKQQHCAQHIRVCDLLRVGLKGECLYVTSQRRKPCLCESASQNQAVPGLEAYADGIHGRPGRSQAEVMDQPGALGCHNPRQDNLRPAAKVISLQRPSAAVLSDIEAFITSVKGKIGPLPVDEDNKKKNAGKHLPWMLHMLTEYEAADAAAAADGADAAEPKHPRIFAILPQIGNRPNFIQLSNSGLHR